MNIEIYILTFTFLTVVAMYFGYMYRRQKMINLFLKQELRLLSHIKQIQYCISKRQSYLKRYNFQEYNLKDALVEQEVPHI